MRTVYTLPIDRSGYGVEQNYCRSERKATAARKNMAFSSQSANARRDMGFFLAFASRRLMTKLVIDCPKDPFEEVDAFESAKPYGFVVIEPSDLSDGSR